MLISDSHNDYFTSMGESTALLKAKGFLVNYAVWGTQLTEREIFAKARDIKALELVLSFEDVSNVKDFNSLIKFAPLWCSLTWNSDNYLAGGAHGDNMGLTKAGKNVVNLFESAGIFLDTAHLSERATEDCIEICTLPVVNSHSCVREVCDNPRNVGITSIGRLLKSGGYFGVCLHSPFLNGRNVATCDDVIAHIDTIVQKYGYKGVGIGSDYYGTNLLPNDLNDYQKFGNLINGLVRLGYSDEAVRGITYQNFREIVRTRYLAGITCSRYS